MKMKQKTRHTLRQIRMRATALLIIFAMAVTSMAGLADTQVFAQNDADADTESYSDGLSNDNLKVSGNNSFGTLLATAIDASGKADENSDYAITGMEISGKTATVQYNAAEVSDLLVAIYSDDGTEMLGFGSAKTDAENDSVKVTINISSMPKYYLAKAFLLDTESHDPLCSAYVCELYTQAIQDIKSKDINDFAEEEVLNLDDDTQTNFAVYSDNVEVISGGDANVYDEAASNESQGSYVFNRANSELTSLKTGDIFTVTSGDDVIIAKVASIKSEKQSDGTYKVTIKEDTDVSLEDVFDYVKIENNGVIDGYTLDYSTADQGVTDMNAARSSGSSIGQVAPISGGIFSGGLYENEFSQSLVDLKYNIHRTSNSIELNVDLHIQMTFEMSVYVALSNSYVDFGVITEASLDGKVTGEFSSEISLPSISADFAGGVASIGFTPTLKFSASAEITVNSKFNYRVGFNCSTRNGLVNTSDAKPAFDFSMNVEGELYFGIEFTPYVSIQAAGFNLVNGSMPVEVGLKMTGAKNESIHSCTYCIDGDIYLVISINAQLSVLGNYDAGSKKLVDETIKLGDWYYSASHDEFGLGQCPYSKCGDNLSWTFDELTGVLTISGDGDMDSYIRTYSDGYIIYEDYKVPWYNYRNDIREVKFNGNVTFVGGGTFYGCDRLITINIPDSVTSIGDGAFYDCSKLTSVTISKSAARIGNQAFYNCDSLPSVQIPDSVNYIGEAAFYDCDRLASVRIPNSVTYLGSGAFSGCASLPSIQIPSSVNYIGDSTFSGCERLTSVNIPSSVTYLGDSAFYGCTSLPSITIPSSITHIGPRTFYNCEKLESIVIPDSVIYFGDEAFRWCSNLKDIYYSGSKEAWDNISVGSSSFDLDPDNNKTIKDVEIHYYSSGPESKTNAIAADLPEVVSFSDILPNAVQSGNAAVSTISLPVSGAAASTAKTASFKSIATGSECLFVVLKSDKAENLFGSDNLLYIDQTTADDSGKVKFTYKVSSGYANPALKLYGVTGYETDTTQSEVKLTTAALSSDREFTAMLVSSDGKTYSANGAYNSGSTTFSFNAPAATYELRITAVGYTTYTDKSFVLGTDKLPNEIEIYQGDINGDGIINAKDNAVIASAFGKRKGNDEYNSVADFNGDGTINAKDKAVISANFTKRNVTAA